MMKNKQKTTRFVRSLCEEPLIKMNLQMFGDDGEGDGSDGSEEDEAISFKNQSELDSWFDKKMSKSLETAKATWDKDQAQRIKDAEKKGKMTAEEQAQYELQQERDQLEADRLSLKCEKDEATTIKRLATDKLPDSLSGTLKPLYGGDEEQLEEAYQAISKSFRDAVESAVNERLASNATPPAGQNSRNSKESIGSRAAKAANERTAPRTDLWGQK